MLNRDLLEELNDLIKCKEYIFWMMKVKLQ